MSFFHLKHSTLKNALNKALELGFVEYVYRTDEKGVKHRDLKANKFSKDGYNTVKLRIADSAHGRILYIHTNLKDLHTQYQNSTSYQSINDVMDLLIIVQTLSLFRKHNKILDCQLRQACLDISKDKGGKLYSKAKTFSQYEHLYRTIQKEIPVGTINILNCGYSIEKILESFGAYLTRYKLSKLLHKANQENDYLFYTWTNVAYIDQTERIKNHSYRIKQTPKNASAMDIFKTAYENYDLKVEGMRQAYRERFIDIDEEGNVINLHDNRGCFISKERKRCLAKPMANTYYMQCDPFVRTGKKHRRTRVNEMQSISTASTQNHTTDGLPF